MKKYKFLINKVLYSYINNFWTDKIENIFY